VRRCVYAASRLLLAMVAALSWAQAAEPRAAPYASADGAHVIDPRSQLVWARCVEGMQWNGRSCIGQPALMTYGEANARAAARAQKEGLPWRLPRVTELRRWAARNGQYSAEVAALFPAAPADWYWTLTAAIDTRAINPYHYDNIQQGRTGAATLGVQQGWALNLATGEAQGDVSRRSRLLVRLVAALPAAAR
jgi:hypothetical protein